MKQQLCDSHSGCPPNTHTHSLPGFTACNGREIIFHTVMGTSSYNTHILQYIAVLVAYPRGLVRKLSEDGRLEWWYLGLQRGGACGRRGELHNMHRLTNIFQW